MVYVYNLAMKKFINKKNIINFLSLWISFVFIQSLVFKFSGSKVTQDIFGTIGEWMSDIPFLAVVAEPFAIYGGYTVGFIELIASIMLIIAIFTKFKVLRLIGATISFVVIFGAIYFHLFTPLGILIEGKLDLFILAVSVFISSAFIIYSYLKK